MDSCCVFTVSVAMSFLGRGQPLLTLFSIFQPLNCSALSSEIVPEPLGECNMAALFKAEHSPVMSSLNMKCLLQAHSYGYLVSANDTDLAGCSSFRSGVKYVDMLKAIAPSTVVPPQWPLTHWGMSQVLLQCCEHLCACLCETMRKSIFPPPCWFCPGFCHSDGESHCLALCL